MLNKIIEDMKTAMRSKDKLRLNAIRMFRAALKDREIELGHSLQEEDIIAIASRLIKQRKDAAEQYIQAERQDLADKELAEVVVLSCYLPEQMNADEVNATVAAAMTQSEASSMRDMGKVMAILKPKLQGKADMGKVSAQVKAALQG